MSDRERLFRSGDRVTSYGSNDHRTCTVVPIEENTGTFSHSQLQEKEPAAVLTEKHLSFHNVSYEVNTGYCGRNQKIILHSVSGLLPTGLNAIMGPTGSGKTSLLDILAGRKGKSGVSGHVLVNGERQPKNFKCASGYVVQDDVVMGTLSVRENLHFSAALRLPSHMTFKQRKERVERVIEELGLERCADTKIGTEYLRGVSGGERKRTNIGMELIIEPQILFLDEPTTGLDAYTALSVVQLLKDWSHLNNTIVIMSIHQPRYSIFKLFDTLTLLSLGNLVYHGNALRAFEYFERIGYVCEEHENPADYFLDVINRCQINPREKDNDINRIDLAATYQGSPEYQELHNVIDPILVTQKDNEGLKGHPLIKWFTPANYATNVFWQFLVLCYRSLKNILRSPQAVFQIFSMLVFAFLVGIIYFRLDKKDVNLQTVISDRLGAFYFIMLTQAFGNLSAIDLLIKQKALFIHENSSGYYRVSAYFLSKVFSDLIPVRIIPLIFYSVVAYFMVGFQVDVAKFFIFFLTVALTSLSAASLAFAVSSLASVTGIAIVVVGLGLILCMLFGGFLIALDSLPDWLRWMKYLSLFLYAFEALSINEIVGQCYCVNGTIDTTAPDFNCTMEIDCLDGTMAISSRGYETSTAWLWYDQIALTALTLIFLALAYFNLRLSKKEK